MTNANVTPLPSRHAAREDIAASVRAHLAVRKISDSELARRVGMSQTKITRRTNANLPFSSDELGKVADVLGISVVELIQMPKGWLPHQDSNLKPIVSLPLADLAAHRAKKTYATQSKPRPALAR